MILIGIGIMMLALSILGSVFILCAVLKNIHINTTNINKDLSVLPKSRVAEANCMGPLPDIKYDDVLPTPKYNFDDSKIETNLKPKESKSKGSVGGIVGALKKTIRSKDNK